ncbi:hypothetical protein [Actinomadura sp. 7K507]|uniref:hypothetical protein n=1 Tax=Actinomadura sp. 7K507 TaxID=2530365 RepID=UPI001053C8B2|nr:hypothetical protein [Actinomadura sp. 7K507]TDC81450.1 hypothetical protein E1285_32625 [Actinomadura sp. 7K507]
MRTAGFAAIGVVGWLCVIVGHYFPWRGYYDSAPLAVSLLFIAYVVAILATVAWVVRFWRRGHHAWASAVGGAAIVLVVTITQVPWNGVFGRSWYAAHHAKFQALADAARQGELHPDSDGWVRGRDSSVPNFGHGLQDVSVPKAPGRVLIAGMSSEEVSENVYLYIYGRPDAAQIDPCTLTKATFGEYYRCTRLSAGWWWLQRGY